MKNAMVSGVVFGFLVGLGAGTAAEPSATWQPGALKLETHAIVMPMRRYNLAYTTSKPVVYRVSVK